MELANGRSKLVEFERVITEFQNQLFRFAFFRTGSQDDSQDIVQDVFIKMYRDNSQFESILNIKNYLYRSITNACIDYQRKRKQQKFDSIDRTVLPKDLYEEDVSKNLIQVEEHKRLERILASLPEEQSETIRMRVLDNLSFVEIASILEIPVTTIKSRFKHGIDKLKAQIISLREA